MEEKKPLPYGLYIMTWAALVVLTGLTVTAAGLHLGALSIYTAIAIAAVKGTLVLFIFMHIKYEPPVFRLMLSVALLTIAVIMALTFSDVAFR